MFIPFVRDLYIKRTESAYNDMYYYGYYIFGFRVAVCRIPWTDQI